MNIEKQTDKQEKTEKEIVAILYTNRQWETTVRHILPKKVRFGSTERHPQEWWMLDAYDTDKQADRSFAMKDIKQRWVNE